MDRPTVEVYERRAREWLDRRPQSDQERDRALSFAARVAPGGTRIDLGCGPGRHTEFLGEPLISLDAAHAMLALNRSLHPRLRPVQADLSRLPLRPKTLGGGWAACSYQHLPAEALPMALAELHWALAPGSPVTVVVHQGEGQGHRPDGDFPGRFFSHWTEPRLMDLFTGAGFEDVGIEVSDYLCVIARRARSLPDTVGPDMRLLICGLNPSLFAADAGAGYARPSNRFWTAAVAAGLVDRPREPAAALRDHGVGMTDLVKRATPRSAELSRDEYVAGAARVQRLIEWLEPSAVCFVGLEGYRAAVDRKARVGWQEQRFGGRPTYVMPSTSGLNAGSRPGDLTGHLRAAAGEPPGS